MNSSGPQDALGQGFVCPFVSASGTRWGGYSQQEDEKGKKKREQVDPQDPFIGLCESNICHGNFGPPKILVRGTKISGKLVRRTIIF